MAGLQRISFRAFPALALVFLAAVPAGAQLRAEIVGPGVMRVPIAAPTLESIGTGDAALEKEFSRVLAGDLDISGLFRMVDPASYIEGVPPGPLGPERINFLNWQAVGARGLLLGRYMSSPDELTVEVAFFDVPGHTMLGGRRFRGRPGEIARMAHRTADAIMEFTTGIPGPFDSKLVFVSDRGGHTRDLFTFSFDGKVDRITNHHSVVMAPAWHPDTRSIVFTSFRDGAADLFSVDLSSRSERKLASKMGLNIGGAWRPDGSVLAVARESGGNTDIYALDFGGQAQQRLTDHWGIDVDPSWSPDGNRLAFCSSRGGTPQVYTMTYPDKKVSRVTFSGSYNCSPVWSPDGRSIAYAGRAGRAFHIYVVPAGGGEPRQLTTSGSDEDPTWSPDSRFIAFSREQGSHSKIFLVDVTGRWERQLTTGEGDDTSPSWSRRFE